MRVRVTEGQTERRFKVQDTQDFQAALLKQLAQLPCFRETGLFNEHLELYLSRHTDDSQRGHFYTIGFRSDKDTAAAPRILSQLLAADDVSPTEDC